MTEVSGVSTAMVAVGDGLHARILLEALLAAGLAPRLLINEVATKRATRLSGWLRNSIDWPPSIADLTKDTPTLTMTVDKFDGEVALCEIEKIMPDYLIMGGGGILKEPMLKAATKGFLNAHPGLLPEHRGLDPVLWSVLKGDPVGATLHLMDSGIDTGPVLIRRELPWRGASSLLELRLQCMRHGAALMAEFLRSPESYPLIVQEEVRAHYDGEFPNGALAQAEARLPAYTVTPEGGNRCVAN